MDKHHNDRRGSYHRPAGQSQIHFSNTGKTPARKVEGRAVIKYVKVGDNVSIDELTYEHGTYLMVGNMFPNETNIGMPIFMASTDVPPHPTIATREMLDGVTGKTLYFVIYDELRMKMLLGTPTGSHFAALTRESSLKLFHPVWPITTLTTIN